MAAPAAPKAQFEFTSEWVAAIYGAAIAALIIRFSARP